jgi:hypothetical protein
MNNLYINRINIVFLVLTISPNFQAAHASVSQDFTQMEFESVDAKWNLMVETKNKYIRELDVPELSAEMIAQVHEEVVENNFCQMLGESIWPVAVNTTQEISYDDVFDLLAFRKLICVERVEPFLTGLTEEERRRLPRLQRPEDTSPIEESINLEYMGRLKYQEEIKNNVSEQDAVKRARAEMERVDKLPIVVQQAYSGIQRAKEVQADRKNGKPTTDQMVSDLPFIGSVSKYWNLVFGTKEARDVDARGNQVRTAPLTDQDRSQYRAEIAGEIVETVVTSTLMSAINSLKIFKNVKNKGFWEKMVQGTQDFSGDQKKNEIANGERPYVPTTFEKETLPRLLEEMREVLRTKQLSAEQRTATENVIRDGEAMLQKQRDAVLAQNEAAVRLAREKRAQEERMRRQQEQQRQQQQQQQNRQNNSGGTVQNNGPLQCAGGTKVYPPGTYVMIDGGPLSSGTLFYSNKEERLNRCTRIDPYFLCEAKRQGHILYRTHKEPFCARQCSGEPFQTPHGLDCN